MDADTASVVARLEAYDRRFEELMAMLSGGQPLRGEEKARAQALLVSLKADLKAENRRMSTARGEGALTPAERAYYAPAVLQCSTEIYVATNTTPDARWHGDLYGARINITHALHELRGGAE